MSSEYLSNFEYMDRLSLQNLPFFFMLDFEVQNLIVVPLDEVQNAGIMFSFPGGKLESSPDGKNPDLSILPSPEPLDSYKKGFDIVLDNLRLGNSYLANYTCRTPIETSANLEDFYFGSNAKYKVYFKDHFCSFTPETFVEIREGRIFTHPMKGTIEASIKDAETRLRENPKEKAEHFTVVDLLRNDLSIVADNVEVDEFQKVDYLKTNRKDLLTMSSKISGTLKPQFSGKIGSILKSLVPAGSILGAPKAKTMEIVKQAEIHERGWYTGVAGVYNGKDLDTCVLIRFISKQGNQYFFHSGGGITHQSQLEAEYEEMINKIYVPVY